MGKEIARGINEGRIKFFDKHLSMFPVDLVYVCYFAFYEKHQLKAQGILYEGQAEQEAGCGDC